MRRLPLAIAALALLVGLVWVLQGAGVLLGSFMSNDPTWLWIGVAVVILGLALLAFGLWGPTKGPAEPPSSGSRTK